MNCAICAEPGISFTKVNHQELGVVLLCNACLAKEKDRILSLPHHSGCSCVWE
jgi:hypothetical protein